MRKHLLAASLALIASVDVAAQNASGACPVQLTATGSALTGRTFATSVELPGVAARTALERMRAYTAANGFVVQQFDPAGGTLTANQANQQAAGRTTPLTVSVADAGGSARVTMQFATAALQLVRDEDVQSHFCATLAAAATATSADAPAPAVAGAPSTAATSPVTGGAANVQRMPPGFATPTAAQLQAMESALAGARLPSDVRAMVNEAAPMLARFLTYMACIHSNEDGMPSMGEFAVPGSPTTKQWPAMLPYFRVANQPKTQCLTIGRLQAWQKNPDGSLSFAVLYRSEATGGTHTMVHTAAKQPDGLWLMKI